MTEIATSGRRALVAACAPLWAGEAEVIRSYWDGPTRTRETDLAWIARQCHKELFDGVLTRIERLRTEVVDLEGSLSRASALDVATELQEELSHYTIFADLYDARRVPGDPPLSFETLRTVWRWAENDELMATRAAHRRAHPVLGAHVEAVTEGGFGTLFSEARRLAGRDGFDGAIAAACARVEGDEHDHMQRGFDGVHAAAETSAEWRLLTELACAQLRLRIRMRWVQFGRPLPEARVRALEDGAGDPSVLALASFAA